MGLVDAVVWEGLNGLENRVHIEAEPSSVLLWRAASPLERGQRGVRHVLHVPRGIRAVTTQHISEN